MRIKLTLQRPNGLAPADLLVNADPQTTVGDLADHLTAADPESGWDKSKSHAIALSEPGAGPLRSDLILTDAGLCSGTSVSIMEADVLPAVEIESPTVAVLAVLSGPDLGRQFPLHLGTSVIGRGRDCDFRLTDPQTSRRHAKVQVGDEIVISDLGSVNGILIGEVPMETTVLQPGDSFHLGDTTISIQYERQPTVPVPAGLLAEPPVTSRIRRTLKYNRPPRVDRAYIGVKITVPDPPTTPRGQRFPIIPLFAPLLMGAALYLSTKSTTSLVFMAMSPLMMAGNVVEGKLAGSRGYQRDMERFRTAVEETSQRVAKEAALEGDARRSEYPSAGECADAIQFRRDVFWCRRPGNPGFGELRLGLGSLSSRTTIEFPHTRQSDPVLLDELHQRFDQYQEIENVPVPAQLDSDGAIGVAGPGDSARAVARDYVLQLVALHSHTELAIVSVCGQGSAPRWEWLKWLPHCAGPQSPIDGAPLTSSQPATSALIGELEGLVRRRSEGGRPPDEGFVPRVLLVVDDPLEPDRSRLMELAKHGGSQGVWIIWVADEISELPAPCHAFVELLANGPGWRASLVEPAQVIEPLIVEPVSLPMAEKLSRTMSPVVDHAARDTTQNDVPRTVSMLSLVGPEVATSPDRVLERWVENRSLLSGPRAPISRPVGRAGNLRAVIGESAYGPHVIDLRMHGPHALVGGTTGAGKSELLQSWVIGMALSNSPQRLTFLLVDYKGGSAFSDCVNLPHTVGLVTDLSPHLVRRALTSLSAELRYREHVLHRKRAKDLAALEREGDPEAPPSLVIVVDEFAALVREVPEFVDGVVNVAQRGRSLGLHLVLATQRPSGVIRENLRANTNLRIALRMADVPDSTDVIGTKVAASFDPAIPGRAVSRTGPTSLVPFQTAYVGGWTSAEAVRPDITVTTLGFALTSAWEHPSDEAEVLQAEGPTDIQRIVATIRDSNQLAEIAEPRKPWLPELAAFYDLAKVPSRRRDDDLVFAVADDPASQQQSAISFRPNEDGNMAIFGTGNSGKSTLLRSLCMAAGFTVRGGPCQVYAVDFGSRGLQMLDQLPHVGSVIPGSDVERVSRLFSMIKEMIDRRASVFAAAGAGSITQFREVTGSGDEPRILLFIDGMGAMRTAYEGTEHHRLFESFLGIAAEGRPVGIHVVITADRAGAVPTALGALIQRRVVLRLAGENDYAMLGQPTDVLDPKAPPGRGLCDGMEIQVAVLGGSADLLAQDLAARSFAVAMRNAGTNTAPPVRRLEEQIPLDGLGLEIDGMPTFAVAAETLTPKGFLTEGTFTVAGPPGSGRTTTIATLVASIKRWRPEARLIYFGSRRSSLARRTEWDFTALDAPEAAKLAPEVEQLLGDRSDGVPGVVVIENVVDFVQGEADLPLQDMVKKLVANGHLVVSDGEPIALSGIQGLVQAVRASRVGLVLQPEPTDGGLFRTQFPRVRKADFPVGRGIYVGRGEQPTVVQVALEGGALPVDP